MILTYRCPDYTQAVGNDSKKVCRLGFLATDEILIHFLESVQVIVCTEVKGVQLRFSIN